MGSGKPEQIRSLISTSKFQGTIVTNPDLTVFTTLGFLRGISGILSFGAMVKGVKAFSAGHKPGGVQGDALQLGGVAIIGSGPVLHYLYKSQKAGDHPTVEDILTASKKAALDDSSD